MHSDHFRATEENTYGDKEDAVIEGDVFTFHYNPDLSGEVLISSNRPHDLETYDINSQNFTVVQEQIVVPGWMLLEFVGRYIQRELEARIDDTSGKEFIQLLLP